SDDLLFRYFLRAVKLNLGDEVRNPLDGPTTPPKQRLGKVQAQGFSQRRIEQGSIAVARRPSRTEDGIEICAGIKSLGERRAGVLSEFGNNVSTSQVVRRRRLAARRREAALEAR